MATSKERGAVNRSVGSPTAASAAGTPIAGGNYRLKRLLGRGSVSEVWLAWDRTRERDLCLKLFPPALQREPALLERLRELTQVCAKLDHPSIVRVYEFVQDRDHVGVLMERVDGWSLAALRVDRPEKRYHIAEIVPWLRQLESALEYAHHDFGLVHRGLQPSNLLLDAREQLKVTDFGLAQIARQALARQDFLIQETLAYFSPQQLAGADPSVLDDVYSLGATLFELLTGTPPFYEGDIAAQVREAVPPLMTGRLVQLGLEGAFPKSWEDTIAACLAKDPARRPQTTEEVLRLLESSESAAPASLEAAAAVPVNIESPPSPTPAAEPEPTPAKAPTDPTVPPANAEGSSDALSGALTEMSPVTPAPAEPELTERMTSSGIRSALWLGLAALGVTVTAGILILWLARGQPSAGPSGSVDAGFNCGAGADNDIRSLLVQPDGKILVGGKFRYFDDSALGGLARLNPDGTPERTFRPEIDGAVHSLGLQPDGRIVIAGDFTTVSGLSRLRIARLLETGALDDTFLPQASLGRREARTLWIQPDGKILVGGSFTSVSGHRRNRIARLNADGEFDSTFQPGAGADGIVWALGLQADGKILAGGEFKSFDNQPHARLVRLNPNGAADTTFGATPGPDGPVLAIQVQLDGKLVVAGEFFTIGNIDLPRIARLQPDGMVDPSFRPGAGANGTVRGLALRPDGSILIAGAFTKVQDVPRNGIALLEADGRLNQRFDPGQGLAGGMAWRVSLHANEKVLVAGAFTNCNGQASGRLARLLGNPAKAK